MLRIEIFFFATIRDRTGIDRLALDLHDRATISELIARLGEVYPVLMPSLATALVAVNKEFAFPEDALHDGDEVAFFPPVSGGVRDDEYPEYFAITEDELNVDALITRIVRPTTGGICVFTGTVRSVTRANEGSHTTDHLVYEAYRPMAEEKLRQVAREIRERFPMAQGIAIAQRVGKLDAGEFTVLVACASGHRHDGIFEAARYGVDRLKEIVPVWKKEIGPDGNAWVEGHYRPTPSDVEPRDTSRLHAVIPVRSRAATPVEMHFGCTQCGKQYPAETRRYACTCGGPLEITNARQFDRGSIDTGKSSIWRYHAMLLPDEQEPVTLGEGWTPLVTTTLVGRTVHLKLESLNPTGSFKDRGAAVMLSALRSHGVKLAHDDSSGNAGAAFAAYATRAGISAQVYVPAYAAPVKLAQIKLYNAALILVDGPRSAATSAAYHAADAGQSYYASHVHNPFALLGMKTIAYELWEQLGFRAPDAVILPVGQGVQLLGLAAGFSDLYAAGATDQTPMLIGVQATTCAPLWADLHTDEAEIQSVSEGITVAEGIRIIGPVRRKAILRAIKASKGDILIVQEEDILDGLRELARAGFIVEPTSAVVLPALQQIVDRFPDDALIVLSLTGSGYKAPQLTQLAGLPRAQDS